MLSKYQLGIKECIIAKETNLTRVHCNDFVPRLILDEINIIRHPLTIGFPDLPPANLSNF